MVYRKRKYRKGVEIIFYKNLKVNVIDLNRLE